MGRPTGPCPCAGLPLGPSVPPPTAFWGIAQSVGWPGKTHWEPVRWEEAMSGRHQHPAKAQGKGQHRPRGARRRAERDGACRCTHTRLGPAGIQLSACACLQLSALVLARCFTTSAGSPDSGLRRHLKQRKERGQPALPSHLSLTAGSPPGPLADVPLCLVGQDWVIQAEPTCADV